MKIDDSNYTFSAVSVNGAIALRSEAQLQGLNNPHIVWECPIGCYDKALKANASVMDGEYIAMNFLPFEEASSKRRCKASSNTLEGTRRMGSRSTAGPLASRLLRRRGRPWPRSAGRVDAALVPPRGDPDAQEVRRRRHVRYGEHADKVPSPCFVLVQLRDGRFVREHPMKKGTFDCKPSNRLRINADLLGR